MARLAREMTTGSGVFPRAGEREPRKWRAPVVAPFFLGLTFTPAEPPVYSFYKHAYLAPRENGNAGVPSKPARRREKSALDPSTTLRDLTSCYHHGLRAEIYGYKSCSRTTRLIVSERVLATILRARSRSTLSPIPPQKIGQEASEQRKQRLERSSSWGRLPVYCWHASSPRHLPSRGSCPGP